MSSKVETLPSSGRGVKKTITVPKFHETYLHLLAGSWLNVNDDEEEGALDQFVNGNVNLSLICALLLTTFLPLMYGEPQRLNIPDDGLTIDIWSGYLNSLKPIVLSKAQIHDWFDTTYLISVAGTLFGTMVSVFYMLAVNEAGDDARAVVFMNSLGRYVMNVPYYFFSIGIIAWGIGAWFQSVLVPKLPEGFWIKQIGLFSMTLVMFLFCFPRMVIGAFKSKAEKLNNLPTMMGKDVIAIKLKEFLANYQVEDINLKDFLNSLTTITPSNYRIPIHPFTKYIATKMYFEELATLVELPVEEVRELYGIAN